MYEEKSIFEDFSALTQINEMSHECKRSLITNRDILYQFLVVKFPISNNLSNWEDYNLCKNIAMNNCMVQIEVNNLEEEINRISPNLTTFIKRSVHVWTSNSIFNLCVPQECNSTDANLFLIEIERLYHNNSKMFSILDIICDDFQMTTPCKVNIITCGFIFITLLSLFLNIMSIFKPNKFLECFSMRRNLIHLFDHTSSTKLSAINGLKALSTLWVIYGHVHEVNIYFPSMDITQTLEWINSYKSVLVIMAPLAVDQFLAINGFLIGFTQKSFITALCKRIVGLIVPMYPMLLIFHTLLSDWCTGPMSFTAKMHLKQTCTDNWWTSYLLIQNYYNPYAMCAGHTWYLAMDLQLFLLSPIILYVINNNKYGAGILAGLTFTLCLWTSQIALTMKLDPTPQCWMLDYFTHVYFASHLRSPVWICGVIAGHLQQQNQFSMICQRKCCFFWFLAVIILILIVIILMHGPYWSMHAYISSIFTGFHRLVWSVSFLWLIVSCANGLSDSLNRFLSMRVFSIISKLSYCTFITHAAVQLIFIGNRNQPFQFNTLSNLADFAYQLFFTCIVSIYWYLFIQCPIVSLSVCYMLKIKDKIY